jgi:hypothetical protein
MVLTFIIKKTGAVPSLGDVLSVHWAAIYSDDSLSSTDLVSLGATMEEWMDHMEYTYSLFGMVRKKTTIKISISDGLVSDIHSFLGSSVRFSKQFNMYYPVPNAGKIASSALFTCERKPVLYTIGRIMALITLIALDESNFDLKEALISYLHYLIKHHIEEIPKQYRPEISDFASRCDEPGFFLFHYFGFEQNSSAIMTWEVYFFYLSLYGRSCF